MGNTKLKLGLWDGDELLAFSIFDTHRNEYKTLIINYLCKQNVRADQIADVIVSSVVPSCSNRLLADLELIFNKKPLLIDNTNTFGLKMKESVQKELGSDLLVCAAYAHNRYLQDLFIISFGTATVISFISEDGEYKSCIIAPGFEMLGKALYGNTDLLPSLKAKKRRSFIADNTVDAMNVGIYDGYIGMVRYLMSSLKRELNLEPYVIGCGGAGKALIPYIKEITAYEPDMVSRGLHYIYHNYYE